MSFFAEEDPSQLERERAEFYFYRAPLKHEPPVPVVLATRYWKMLPTRAEGKWCHATSRRSTDHARPLLCLPWVIIFYSPFVLVINNLNLGLLAVIAFSLIPLRLSCLRACEPVNAPSVCGTIPPAVRSAANRSRKWRNLREIPAQARVDG